VGARLAPDVRAPAVVTFPRSTSPVRSRPPGTRCKSIRHAAERRLLPMYRKTERPVADPPEILRISRERPRGWTMMKREIHLRSIFPSVYGLIDERFSSTFVRGF